MTQKHIFRIEKNKLYTVMSNYHLNDKSISWQAKGLHSYILSKPDDWKVIIEELIKASTNGRDSTRRAIDELYANNYWQKYKVYVNGLVHHWETIVYETPFEEDIKIKHIKYSEDKKIITFVNGTIQILKNEKEIDFSKKQGVNDKSVAEPSNEQKEFDHIKEYFRKSLYLDEYRQREGRMIDEIELNLLEMYFSENTIIKGEKKPQIIVRTALMKLTNWHIEELIQKYKSVSFETSIINPKSYIQSMIYNLAFESDLSTTNAVIYDGHIKI